MQSPKKPSVAFYHKHPAEAVDRINRLPEDDQAPESLRALSHQIAEAIRRG